MGPSMAEPGPFVVNPSARTGSGMVEVVVPVAGEAGPDIQVLSERFGLPGTMTLDAGTVRNMLGLIQGARIDADTYVDGVSLAADDDGHRHHPGHRHRARDRDPPSRR